MLSAMINLKDLLKDPEKYKTAMANKGYDPIMVDKVIGAHDAFKNVETKVESLRNRRRELGKNSTGSIDEGKIIKEELKDLEPQAETLKTHLDEVLNHIPNPAFEDVPIGKNDEENVEISNWGKIPQFPFTPESHLDIGKRLDIIDFEAGAKVTGSHFYFLYNEGVLLELALVMYAFNLLVKKGFIPVITPDLAKSRFYLGTGYQPRGDEAQTYVIEGEDLGLIATAEVTLAGKHADEIIPYEKLPLMYVGYSHAFRQESGAYGKYSKGMYRVHQFSKVEMFVFCLPEQSKKYHAMLLEIEEQIYQELEIPYRVLEMCTGDLGAMAARKIDIEAWMPGRNDYGEVTSTSNCTDFQARNLNIKYKKPDGSTEYVHMLNATAIALSRVPIAILENFQQADGSVLIPKVLQPYMGMDKIAPKGK
jgi:seryl-tRNA synthetase